MIQQVCVNPCRHVYFAEIERLEAENSKLRATLESIANKCPATCEITLAHEMADEAIEALGPEWLKAQREGARKRKP